MPASSEQAVTLAEAKQPAEQAPKKEKKTRISKRLRQVIDLLATPECKTIKAAAEKVGMHPDYLSRALKEPHVGVFIERRARETIGAGLLRASNRLVELVDAQSEHVAADASKHLLAIRGIKPAAEQQISVSLDLKAGFVIDLSEGKVEQSLNSHAPTLDLKANTQESTPLTRESGEGEDR